MKTTLLTLVAGLALSTAAFAFPVEIDAKTVYGIQMPALGQTDTTMVMFKDKSARSGTTYFKVEVKPSFTTNRFDGRIVEQCDLTSCKPVNGWIVDPSDNTYGVKVDIPVQNNSAIMASSMLNSINNQLKDMNVSPELKKFYDKMQRELSPTMTLKADASAKLIVNYDVNTSFGYCNLIDHEFKSMYGVMNDTLNLISDNHSDSCFNHSPKEMSDMGTQSDVYLFLLAYKFVAGDSAYIDLYAKAMGANAKTIEQIKEIAESMPKVDKPVQNNKKGDAK